MADKQKNTPDRARSEVGKIVAVEGRIVVRNNPTTGQREIHLETSPIMEDATDVALATPAEEHVR